MANPRKGQVKIRLGGKPYTLEYDFNAIVALEETLGVPVQQISARLNSKVVGFREIRALIHAGLQAHHEDLTLREVGKLIPLDRMDEFAESVDSAFESLTLSMQGKKRAELDEEEADPADPPPAEKGKEAAGTGNSS